MGLDLVVEGCAKPGHEAEWRRFLERAFGEDDVSEADIERFMQISIPGYERVGAPRVGYDQAADDWIVAANKASTPDDVAAVLKEYHGYHALGLVSCDGVPGYTHGGLYEGVDETSFRGSFLEDCGDVLSKDQISEAWNHRFPDEAIGYGRELLAAADGASPASERPQARQGLFARLLGKQAAQPLPFEEQLKIVRAAGRWFIFWGERGHAIRAWF